MDPKQFKNIWDKHIDSALHNINTSTSKFKIKPVTPKEFFEVWLKEPLFPEQYRIINQVFTPDFQDWRTDIKEILLLWGEGGCVSGNIMYRDPVTKEQHYIKTWAKLRKPFHVISYNFNESKFETVLADIPVYKGKSKIYKVIIKTGKKNRVMRCTLEHKFYTPTGWKELRHLKVGDLVAFKDPGNAYLSTLSKEERSRLLGRKGPQNGRYGKKNNPRAISEGLKKSAKYQQWLKSPERKILQQRVAEKLRQIALSQPEKYAHGKGGRCKWEYYVSPIAGRVKIQGSFEKAFASWLDSKAYVWKRCTQWFKYTYRGQQHNYQPDFIVYHDDGTKTYYEN